MKVQLFICAESVSLDLRKNSVSAFHIIEEINSPSFPLFTQPFSVVAMIDRTINNRATRPYSYKCF